MPHARFGDVRRLETIDSTNRYLLAEARAGAPEGVVAVAEFQTAGRGRQGRRWTAPPGRNLLLSVLLRPRLGVHQRPLAATVVALAARDAVRRVFGVDLGVKWPNDLVAQGGGKVAGVLAETDVGEASVGSGRVDPPAVVVGIGVNCNWPDWADVADLEGDLARAVSLRMVTSRPVDREALLLAFLDDLGPRVDELGGPVGRLRQLSELRTACVTLGSPVRVELAERIVEGTATELTDEGHLVVRTNHGLETVTTGDVIHLRAAPRRRPSEGSGGAQD